jgi:hypothetical protein
MGYYSSGAFAIKRIPLPPSIEGEEKDKLYALLEHREEHNRELGLQILEGLLDEITYEDKTTLTKYFRFLDIEDEIKINFKEGYLRAFEEYGTLIEEIRSTGTYTYTDRNTGDPKEGGTYYTLQLHPDDVFIYTFDGLKGRQCWSDEVSAIGRVTEVRYVRVGEHYEDVEVFGDLYKYVGLSRQTVTIFD